MKTVGLRELKNHLSRCIGHVRDGETVAITDRGRVIAELTPPRTPDKPRAVLDTMASRGELTRAKPLTKTERSALYTRLPNVLRSLTSRDLLDADREEH